MKITDANLQGVTYNEIGFKPEYVDASKDEGQWDLAVVPYNDPELQEIINCKKLYLAMEMDTADMNVYLYVSDEQEDCEDSCVDYTEFNVEFSVAEKISLHKKITAVRDAQELKSVRLFVEKRLEQHGYNDFSLSSDRIEERMYTADWVDEDMRINVSVLIDNIDNIGKEYLDMLILEYNYVQKIAV